MVTRADLISAGDHSGCTDLSKATIPATCGAAIDVPDMIAKELPNDAKMLTPGAAISGWFHGITQNIAVQELENY